MHRQYNRRPSQPPRLLQLQRLVFSSYLRRLDLSRPPNHLVRRTPRQPRLLQLRHLVSSPCLRRLTQPTPEPSRSTHAKTAATAVTPTPSILPVPTTPRLEPTPEPSRSTLRATVQPTPTLKPLKSRVVRHQPNQFRKGALGKEELTAVKKALRGIQWSRNSDPKAAALEDYKAIVKECATSSVHDLLADLITEAASNDYQPGNEGGNRTYSDELISNFEARVKDEREAQGPPSQRR